MSILLQPNNRAFRGKLRELDQNAESPPTFMSCHNAGYLEVIHGSTTANGVTPVLELKLPSEDKRRAQQREDEGRCLSLSAETLWLSLSCAL